LPQPIPILLWLYYLGSPVTLSPKRSWRNRPLIALVIEIKLYLSPIRLASAWFPPQGNLDRIGSQCLVVDHPVEQGKEVLVSATYIHSRKQLTRLIEFKPTNRCAYATAPAISVADLPMPDGLKKRVRYRIDGVLRRLPPYPRQRFEPPGSLSPSKSYQMGGNRPRMGSWLVCVW